MAVADLECVWQCTVIACTFDMIFLLRSNCYKMAARLCTILSVSSLYLPRLDVSVIYTFYWLSL